MSEANRKTIQVYEEYAVDYIRTTPPDVAGGIKQFLDTALNGLDMSARILEIGSGFGRDARYIIGKGYAVKCTDAAAAFIKVLRQKGLIADQLNVITDEILGTYDLVVADAVLVHFEPEETKLVLKKVFDSLESGGKFAFTLLEEKSGVQDKWSDTKLGTARYFRYWRMSDILNLMESIGYTDISIKKDDCTGHVWLQIHALKPKNTKP